MDAGHHDRILDQFTRQAVPFSAAPAIRNQEALDRMVEMAEAGPDDTVLDVACGPGLVVCAFARVVRHATGILIHRWAEIDESVWLESHAPIVLGARRVARGTRIYGGVTLGSGGTRGRRGVPSIGRNVVIGPGAAVVGLVEVPDNTVIGPNTLITSSPSSGAWLGSPPMRWRRDPQLLVPA